MTNKPGWTGSLAVTAIGLVGGLAVGARALRRERDHVGPAAAAGAGA